MSHRPDMWNATDFIEPPDEWRNSRVERAWQDAVIAAESAEYRGDWRPPMPYPGNEGAGLKGVAGAYCPPARRMQPCKRGNDDCPEGCCT